MPTHQVFSVPQQALGRAALLAPVPKVALFFLSAVAAAVAECETGHAIVVVESLKAYEGTGSDRTRCLAEYLRRFHDAVDYENARASGYPTGSGEVESAHRYIPQKRLKIPGACWSPANLNPMLALRVLRENDWWDDFWAVDAAPRAAA